MNAVGIDVSKGKSMIAIMRPFGEIVSSPEVTRMRRAIIQKFLNYFHFYAFLTTGLGNLPVSIIVSSILANPSGSRI